MIIDTVKWNGLAKKSGIEMGDKISEFKIENLDRPNKAIIYPFALLFLFELIDKISAKFSFEIIKKTVA